MRLIWQVEDEDILQVKSFYESRKDSAFVRSRRETNVDGLPPQVSRASFWKAMVGCLLTTQQRSGPEGAVSRFGGTYPFPLNYTECRRQQDLQGFVRETLTDFGGIRRTGRLAEEVYYNFSWLEKEGGWREVEEQLEKLRRDRRQAAEIRTADIIDDSLKGFGPKQSRNLLQGLGLTKYEIPIDSRITRWLNEFGFPITLSAKALADRSYYRIVSEGIRQLCDACRIYPCLLDAAIFSSYDLPYRDKQHGSSDNT